jgi:hypothetical protein
MTNSRERPEILERNIFALLAHGTVVWYCDHCDYTSEGALSLAGLHLREKHPRQLRDADQEYQRMYP